MTDLTICYVLPMAYFKTSGHIHQLKITETHLFGGKTLNNFIGIILHDLGMNKCYKLKITKFLLAIS